MIREGDPVVNKATGVLIYARCNCPASPPMQTVRYINDNWHLFDHAPEGTLRLPAPITLRKRG